MENNEIEPKCCHGVDGRCYCHNLSALCVCGGSDSYTYKNCCAYACNNWSVPLEATGIGCRFNWNIINCKTNSNDCAECCKCLCCEWCDCCDCCESNKLPYECCRCPVCYPSVLFGNLHYCSSGHIFNLSICSMFQQCCLCHPAKDCLC